MTQSFPERIPAAYAASVPWCLYWCCHALDVLGAAATAIGPALRAKLWGALHRHVRCMDGVRAIRAHDLTSPPYPSNNQCRCQQPDGGFAGLLDAPRTNTSTNISASHVLSTYAALSTAAILLHTNSTTSSPPSWLSSKAHIKSFLFSLKHPTDGTFRATPAADAETDARSVYGALAVARLAGLLDDGRLVERGKLVAYLTALQTHEGGFSAAPGDDEAHAGFSYCALAALRLLGAVDLVRDPEGLLRWAAQRQRPFEGGCSGRTNKLVDACYSFWAGALPPLLMKGTGVLHAGALARYLLAVSQAEAEADAEADAEAEAGGFADKPGAEVDHYHTCYALSGLALAVHDLDHDALLLTGLRGRVRRVDVAVNLCHDTLRAWDAARGGLRDA